MNSFLLKNLSIDRKGETIPFSFAFFLGASKPEVLSLTEKREFEALLADVRKQSFLSGRYVAKEAFRALLEVEVPFEDITIEKGVFDFPLVRATKPHNLEISFSHSGSYATAISFPDFHPMGIDIEVLDNVKPDVVHSQITKAEYSKVFALVKDEILACAQLWTAKEALSKVIKTGLMIDFQLLEIENVELLTKDIYAFSFLQFPQYKAIVFNDRKVAFSIVLPARSMMLLDDFNWPQ